MPQILILDPTAKPHAGPAAAARGVETLHGKVVAILNNRWKSMDLVAARFDEVLRRDHGVREVLQRVIPATGPAPETVLEEVASRAEVAIVGLAN